MIKKILLNTLAFVLMLVLFNFIYERFFYQNDIKKHSEIYKSIQSVPNQTDVLYLGESSNITFRNSDTDKRSISEMMSDYLSDVTINDITQPASHAGIYKMLLQELDSSKQIKTVVITLNLRSFNAQWINSDLELPLQKALVLLRDNPPLINRIMLSFKNYDNRTKAERQHDIQKQWKKDEFVGLKEFPFKNVVEWDNWMANNENYTKTKRDLACHYIKGYGFQIDFDNNPRIKDFDEIVELAKERNWNLVFNLLAENTQKADELVGEDLTFMMNQNTQNLIKYYENKGVTVVNNLNRVEDEQFIDQNWTTEHYAEKGRKTIARNVAEALKKWHLNDSK